MSDDEESGDEYEDNESGSEEEADDGKIIGMAYEKETVSSVRMRATMWEERLERQEEETREMLADTGVHETDAAEAVRRLLLHRFGNITRGWRDVMDKRGVHRVGRADFFTALRELGFHGNAKVAWCDLTGTTPLRMTDPKNRQVTLADLDDDAARKLSEFFRYYTEELGTLPSLLRKSDGKRVGEAEFMKRCKQLAGEHFDRSPLDLKFIFKNLSSHGAVTEEDLLWLQDYCMREKPARAGAIAPREDSKMARERAARARCLQAFRELIQHKFGSIVNGWRKVLDPESKGELTKEDFKEAAERLQFKGSVADVWDALVFDRGRSKSRFPVKDPNKDPEESDEEVESEDEEDQYALHLGDLEPTVVDCITSFQKQCLDRYGTMAKAFEDMVAEKKPLVTREEFLRFCNEVRFTHNKHLLWDALDERNVGAILLSDLDGAAAGKAFPEDVIKNAADVHIHMEQVKKGRITLRQRAAKQCGAVKKPPEQMKSSLVTLQKQLLQRFDSPVRAWAGVLDPKNKGKIKTDAFLVGCAAAGFRGSKTKLLQELQIEKGSSVRFKTLAPDVIDECKEFKTQAAGKIGAIVKSIEASGPAEKKKQGIAVKMKGFEKICNRIGYTGDKEKIFAHLDIGADGSLNTKFLKTLDPSGKEDKVVSNMLKKHHEQKQKRHQQTMTEKVIPPVAQLKAKQDSLLVAGREKRGKKTQCEAHKKEMFRFLEKNVGSVGRAWRLAFDPENRGEVEEKGFLQGLQRSGFLDTSATDEDMQKAKNLFELLADEETGAITLDILDKRTTDGLYQFRCRMAGRYGSVKQAFLEIDPEGTGIINKEQIRLLCHEAKMTDNIRRLLEYLDPNDEDEIHLDQIDEQAAKQAKDVVEEVKDARDIKADIDERKGRSHMKSSPPSVGVSCGVEARRKEREREAGQKLLGEFKRRLIREHGTLVRAWQNVLKPEGKGPISFGAFRSIWESMGMSGEAKAAWMAIDRKGKSLSLSEFDPGADGDFRELRARIAERYGSLEKAFDELDEDESFQLDMKGFLNLCYECQFRRNERRLFAYLDHENTGSVSLRKIDQKAVQRVIARREKDAEARALREGRADEDDESELSTPSSPGKKSRDKTALQATGEPTPARGFREQLQRRFGSMVRAWHMIDFNGKGALTKKEFAQAVQSTGYAGNASTLWSALGVDSEDGSLISFRELDPEVFALLSSFRERCENRGGLEKVFTKANTSTENRLSREEFQALCKKVRFPKTSWQRLFEQLDVKNQGSVTWEEIRFLEEQWDWEEEPPKPIRNAAGTNSRWLPSTSSSPALDRTSGIGHMCMSMRPRIITGMRKSNSLPAISAPLRDNWNDRHHVLDAPHNKDIQMMHMVTQVQTKERERIKRRVENKMIEVPTMQWLEENMPEGYGEDPDADYGEEAEEEDYGF